YIAPLCSIGWGTLFLAVRLDPGPGLFAQYCRCCLPSIYLDHVSAFALVGGAGSPLRSETAPGGRSCPRCRRVCIIRTARRRSELLDDVLSSCGGPRAWHGRQCGAPHHDGD